jgi:hypothetical protein
MLTIVFLAAILTVFQLFGLWFRLRAIEQQVSDISELLLPLLREECATPEYPPSVSQIPQSQPVSHGGSFPRNPTTSQPQTSPLTLNPSVSR